MAETAVGRQLETEDADLPMKIIGVVPARMASSRFPGKPLFPIRGHNEIVVRRHVSSCMISIRSTPND